MSLKDLMGFVLSAATLLPFALIIVFKLYRLRSFIALGIYYILVFIESMMKQQYIQAGEGIQRIVGMTYNMLDVPLLLIFFIYFSPSLRVSRQLQFFCIVFIAYEVIITAFWGYNRNGLTYTIGPGLAILLSFCTWFFIRQVKISAKHKKSIGKAVITSALLFAFGCYSIIYIMYYLIRTSDTTDVYVMYLISSALSVIVVSAGIAIENKRIQKLIELKVTRRELSMIYGNKK